MWSSVERLIGQVWGRGQPEPVPGAPPADSLYQTQQALLQERQRLLYILEGTQAGTWEWNIRTGQVIVNARFASLLGYTLEEMGPLTADSMVELIHPEEREMAVRHRDRYVAGLEPRYEMETRRRHRDGSYVWLLTRGQINTRTPDGKPEWMFGTHLDITALRTREQTLRETETILHRVELLARVGGWERDIPSGRVTTSAGYRRITGLPDGVEPTLEHSLSLYLPGYREEMRQVAHEAMTNNGQWDRTAPIRTYDGRLLWVRNIGSVSPGPDGRPMRMVGAIKDITELVMQREALERSNQELQTQKELLRVTLASIGDGVITTDGDSRVTWLNPAAERLTGWSLAEVQALPLAEVFRTLDAVTGEPVAHPFTLGLDHRRAAIQQDHTVLESRSGAKIAIEDSAAPILDQQGNVLGIVLVFHDVSERRRLSQEMQYRATYDQLTGLLNRTEFESRLNQALVQAQETGCVHALLYIDLDQFKLVNDTCGYLVGDELLVHIARLLQDAVRNRDALARLGGDEFAVILDYCTTEQAYRVAGQICAAMEEFRFAKGEHRFRMGASIGLVAIDRRWPSLTELFQAADACCHAAKAMGRNRVHVWVDSDRVLLSHKAETQWAARIQQALESDQFTLHAQRITSFDKQGHADEVEVLLRLQDVGGQLIAPAAFLPAAERFHLAPRIDRWVLQRVLALLMRQPPSSLPGLLCINVSARSLADRNFHAFVLDALQSLDPVLRNCLCFELNETVAVTNLIDSASFIRQVRELGVRIALDDFGSGMSSFGYLKNLPVDVLKIDSKFVAGLIDNPLDVAAVRSFVEVARVLGVRTVAEAVESDQVMQALRDLGVGAVQGYLLHTPVPLEDLLASLHVSVTPSG